MPRLEFPSTQGPIGKLEVSGMTADHPLPAEGTIEVPEGASVSLTIDVHVPLEAIDGLEPDSLTILRLDHPSFTDEDLVHVSRLSGLQRLVLVNTGVTDGGLAHIRRIEGLARLFLDGTRVTDDGVVALSGSRLQRLSLNNTEVGDGALAAAAQIGTLTHLMVANTHVTDEGLKHLSEMTHLALLDVSESEVTGQGLVHLPHCLALVVLCEGPKVSDEQLESTRRSRPDLILNGVRHWTPPAAER